MVAPALRTIKARSALRSPIRAHSVGPLHPQGLVLVPTERRNGREQPAACLVLDIGARDVGAFGHQGSVDRELVREDTTVVNARSGDGDGRPFDRRHGRSSSRSPVARSQQLAHGAPSVPQMMFASSGNRTVLISGPSIRHSAMAAFRVQLSQALVFPVRRPHIVRAASSRRASALDDVVLVLTGAPEGRETPCPMQGAGTGQTEWEPISLHLSGSELRRSARGGGRRARRPGQWVEALGAFPGPSLR